MSVQSLMFEDQTSPDIPSVISSPASADGASLSGSPDGLTMSQSGPDHAPVSRSPRQESKRAKKIPATFGLTFGDSSPSQRLTSSLGNRLQTRLASVGSMEYAQTWKTKAYALGVAVLGSHSVGAPHIRQRLYWVAQPEHTIGRPEHKEHSEAHRGNGFGGSREPFRLGDSDDTRPQGRRIDAGEYADQCSTRPAGSIGGLGEPDCTGRLSGRQAGETTRYRDTAQSAGYWSDFDIVHCTDNKARRIEPGTFPLAHGIPARMGRLRGYGNAITPEVACEFVIACMEIGL